MSKQYPILNRLTIDRVNKWKNELDDPVQYEGEAEFLGENSKTSLHLDDRVSRELINVVSEQLVESSKTLATKLTAEFISGDALLAPPEDPDSPAD